MLWKGELYIMADSKQVKREPKTLFEHLGIGNDNGKGIDLSKNPLFIKLKPIAILLGIGFVIGMMVDIWYGSNIGVYILPLGFLLIILIKMYKSETDDV